MSSEFVSIVPYFTIFALRGTMAHATMAMQREAVGLPR